MAILMPMGKERNNMLVNNNLKSKIFSITGGPEL
jgi:hypothetical protein